MNQASASIIGLDVGTIRIGVAMASWPDGIASPYATLGNDAELFEGLKQIIKGMRVRVIVVGMPRSLSGQRTQQTGYVDTFVARLKAEVTLPVHLQDEAVTSVQAEEELKQRHKTYTKEDIDALSATYILEDFIREHRKGGAA